MSNADLAEELLGKIKTLNERIWESRAHRPAIDAWLDNFSDDWDDSPSERVHALFLLSHFTYFGDKEIRELLRALFRDLFRYPIVEELRVAGGGTLHFADLRNGFMSELERTRFIGLGNPAESGTHLLYYFRQENRLTKRLFVHTHQVFDKRIDAADVGFAEPNVKRYILIDDFCGSGDQATEYSDKVVSALRDAAKRAGSPVEVCYYVLFATTHGLERIRADADFDRVGAVFELDGSYRAFDNDSRYFRTHPPEIDRDFAHQICNQYGARLWSPWPLGYRDGQLLIGFHHNTPDNTLPVIWFEAHNPAWTPIFRRYHKM